VEKKKYPRLLDLWVKGLAFDWERLYGDAKPRRMSLPSYPFAKRRFWISLPQEPRPSDRADAAPEARDADLLESLLDGIVSDEISIDDAVARAERSMSAPAGATP
jgi:acyl transferase domain-containing protein